MAIGVKDAAEGEAPLPTTQKMFSTRLVLELASRKGNLFVSPYSAWSLLALLRPGARGATREKLDQVLGVEEGEVLKSWTDQLREEMEEVVPREFRTLDLQGPRESFPESFVTKKKREIDRQRFELIVANALWLQEGWRLRPEYIDEVKEQFDARIEELDLVGEPALACDTINAWAAENTRGRISEVFSPGEIRSLTRLILTNATYFKDEWVHKFEPENTGEEPFHRLEGRKVKVPTMHQTSHFGYFERRGLQAVRLPYLQSDLTMTVVLPKRIRKFETAMTPESLDQLLNSTNQTTDVHLAMPRYRFGCELRLNPELEALGLGLLLGPSADFSGVSSEPGIYVDLIKQLGWVQIDEEGTEAAAVTVGAILDTMALGRRAKPKQMIVDRPYWFFIRDERSGTMLFAGRVEDPSE